MAKRRLVIGTALFLVSGSVTCLFFINLCDLIYDCGCVSWWNGAAAHCNIHQPDMRHCPWCSGGGIPGYSAFAAILLAQAWVSFWPAHAGFARRAIFALLAFPLVGALAGLAWGWYYGYWT